MVNKRPNFSFHPFWIVGESFHMEFTRDTPSIAQDKEQPQHTELNKDNTK